MSDRDNLALLFLMLLITVPLGCAAKENSSFGCDALWMDCPGVANDYLVCNLASDLQQQVSGGARHFSYYNCALKKRTPTLTAPNGCVPTFKY